MGAGALTICHHKAAVQVKEDMKRMVQLPMLRPQTTTTTTTAATTAAASTTSAAVRGSRQFGVPLSELCALGLVAEEDGVPLVVRRMVEHLRQHALQQEGLFRVNGNVRAVETLKQRLQSGEEVDLLAEAEVCTVASLLKQYLRDLPEGLVHAAVQAALIQQYQECGEDGSWGDLRAVLRQLPDVHHRLLSYFCHFLTEVASHHQHNRMTALNLATVFGPSVFHVSPGFEAMKEQNICNKIMAKLIQNYSNIFDSSRDGDKDGCTGELPTLIIVKEAHLMNVDSESSPTTSSPRSPKSPVHAKKKVKKAMGDEVSPATPQPSFSAGTPHVRQLAPQPSSAILEQMAPPPRPPSPPTNTSPSSSVELHDCFPEEERAISPFYMSNHLFPIHCRPDVTNFLDRTIRAAVQQHLFEINPLDCPGVQGPALRGPSLLGPGVQGPGLQGPRELAPCSGPPLLTTSARQRRRQQREQKEEEGEREPEKSRSTSSLRADLHKENIPWDKQNLLNTLSEGNLAVGVAPQQTQRVQNHHQPRTPKPWKPRPGPTLAQHNENLETPTVQVQECSMTGTASRSEGATMDAPPAARRRKESWSENGLPPPQRPRMKIQESLGVCGVGERSPRGLADTDCGEARDDVPRLELAEEDDGNWGEPVPAYSSWQRDSMDREEARLSPHASGHLIRQLMEEGNDPMLSPRFYGYGHCQQYLDDTEVPPSPPNAHSFSSRRRSCSLGSCDEEKEELSSAQLSKRIHVLKKKIHRFEEKFEYERKYRPSHSDKLANPEVLRWVNELTRLRKNLKEHKLLKSEEDLPPQTRQRSNTLPKSFGSQLDKKSQQEKTPLPPAESTLEVVLSKLREKREEVGRPEDVKDMSREQIGAEKLALQKALLYYESIHGRPVTKSERQTMKPLYDRYRLVKQILCRASSIPVIGSPSSKRRGPLLQPIIEGVPALFFDDIKEEEDGSEDDGDSRPQVPASDRPNLSMLGFLDQLEEEAADGFISPLDDLSPTRSTTHDMRLSNLHSATMQELVEQLQETREEKKRIRMNLREYEDQFFRENGRNLQKEERSPLALEYNEYKHVKAKLRLLEVLISKRDSTKFI